MAKWIIALFFFGFAAIHGGWEQSPAPANTPSWWAQRPGDSWVLTRIGVGDGLNQIAQILWIIATLGFIAAGFGVLGWVVPTNWWQPLAIGSATISLLLAVFYWHPLKWGSALVDVAIIVSLLWARWPSEVTSG